MSEIKASDWKNDSSKPVSSQQQALTKEQNITPVAVRNYKKKKKASSYNEMTTILLILGLALLLVFTFNKKDRGVTEDADTALTQIYDNYKEKKETEEKKQNADPITKFFMETFSGK